MQKRYWVEIAIMPHFTGIDAKGWKGEMKTLFHLFFFAPFRNHDK
jgi:hypothetical protein